MERTTEPNRKQGRQQHSRRAHHLDPGGPSAQADGPQPEGLYLDGMNPEDRAAFQAASATPDLATEIRIMRAVLSRLTGDLAGNYLSILRVFTVLIRAIRSTGKGPDNAGAREQILLEEGEVRIVQEETS